MSEGPEKRFRIYDRKGSRTEEAEDVEIDPTKAANITSAPTSHQIAKKGFAPETPPEAPASEEIGQVEPLPDTLSDDEYGALINGVQSIHEDLADLFDTFPVAQEKYEELQNSTLDDERVEFIQFALANYYHKHGGINGVIPYVRDLVRYLKDNRAEDIDGLMDVVVAERILHGLLQKTSDQSGT